MGADNMEWDDWDTQEILYIAFGIVGGLIVFFSICCACCNRRRQQRKSAISSHTTHSNHFDNCAQSNDDEDVGKIGIVDLRVKCIMNS